MALANLGRMARIVPALAMGTLLAIAAPALAQSRQVFQVQARVALVDPPSTAWKPRESGGLVLSPRGQWLFAAAETGIHAFKTTPLERAWHLRTAERVASRPVLVGTTLYAATQQGALYALDARDGKKLWAEPTRLDQPVYAALSADDRHVYVVADPASVVAVDRRTGKPAWRYAAEITRDFLVEGHGGALVWQGLVLVGLPDGRLVALAGRDGGLTWETKLDQPDRSPYSDVDTTPILVQQPGQPPWVLAASHSGGLYALEADDGVIQWRYPIEGLGEPLVDRDRVVVLAATGELHVVRLKDGQRLAARKLGTAVLGGTTLASPGVVLAPTEMGLDALSAWTGQGLGRAGTETGFAAAPVTQGNTVYALSNGGVLYAFAVRDVTGGASTLW